MVPFRFTLPLYDAAHCFYFYLTAPTAAHPIAVASMCFEHSPLVREVRNSIPNVARCPLGFPVGAVTFPLAWHVFCFFVGMHRIPHK